MAKYASVLFKSLFATLVGTTTGMTLCRRILSGDDNKAMTKVTMEFNISNGCSLNGIASGCPMNFGLARKNTGAPSLQF